MGGEGVEIEKTMIWRFDEETIPTTKQRFKNGNGKYKNNDIMKNLL